MLRLSVNVACKRSDRSARKRSHKFPRLIPRVYTPELMRLSAQKRAASLSSSLSPPPLFAVTLTSLSNAGHTGRRAKRMEQSVFFSSCNTAASKARKSTNHRSNFHANTPPMELAYTANPALFIYPVLLGDTTSSASRFLMTRDGAKECNHWKPRRSREGRGFEDKSL